MSEELIPVVGYGFIALVVLAMAAAPQSWWAQELARRYGVRPSGPFGTFTRRDHLRRATASACACVGFVGACFAMTPLLGRWPVTSQPALITETYLFAFFVLGGMGLLAMLEALWRAIFFRPQPPPLVLDPTEWRVVADLLDRLAAAPIPELEWATFAGRPMRDPTMQRVRDACLRLCAGQPRRFSGPLSGAAHAWAGALRAAM